MRKDQSDVLGPPYNHANRRTRLLSSICIATQITMLCYTVYVHAILVVSAHIITIYFTKQQVSPCLD